MAIKKYYDSDCNLGVLSSASAARAMPIPRTWPRAA